MGCNSKLIINRLKGELLKLRAELIRARLENRELKKEDLLKKDESTSIESQRMIIESFCKYHNLELVEEYVDDGYSGGNFERPGFKRMIEDIESGKIDCILTKDFSRLGRELYQTGSFIEDYLIITVSMETKYPKEAIKRIKNSLQNLEMNEESLRRKVNSSIATLVLNYDDIAGVNNALQEDILSFGKVIDDVKLHLENITLKEVNEVIKKIDTKNMAITIMNPEN